MNESLERLAKRLDLDAARNERLRLEFGHVCVRRVEHLLEEREVVDCLAGLGRYLDGAIGHEQLQQVCAQAAGLANRHQGSTSIDGCGHAAVSDPESFEPEYAWQVERLDSLVAGKTD